MNTNIERVKKINSIKEVTGTNPWRDEYKPLFLIRNNMGKQGVVDDSGTTVVDVEYDSIFPIGYGIWICSKASKFGAFAFDGTQDGTLYIKGWIDCKYDYFKAIAGGPAVSLYTYDFESYDRKDTFIGSTGELIKHSDCEWVKYLDTTSKYCLISNEGKTYIYDTKSGERFYIKDAFYRLDILINNGYIYLSFVPSSVDDDRCVMYLINQKTGELKETEIFDGIPIVVQQYVAEKSESYLNFIVKKGSKKIFLDEELNEISEAYDSVGLITTGYGCRGKKNELVFERELARAHFSD